MFPTELKAKVEQSPIPTVMSWNFNLIRSFTGGQKLGQHGPSLDAVFQRMHH